MKKANGAERPVIVTTAHRGVFFGYATDPLLLCAPVGLGVAGLWRWDSHADALPRETAEVVSASCGQVESTDDNAAIAPARQSGLDRSGHTQATDEVYFATMKLKRGIVGTFHHVGKGHLGKYVSEFEFRYNARKVEDKDRPVLIVNAAEGKRLTYKQPVGARPN